jgi:hypothetical protein
VPHVPPCSILSCYGTRNPSPHTHGPRTCLLHRKLAERIVVVLHVGALALPCEPHLCLGKIMRAGDDGISSMGWLGLNIWPNLLPNVQGEVSAIIGATRLLHRPSFCNVDMYSFTHWGIVAIKYHKLSSSQVYRKVSMITIVDTMTIVLMMAIVIGYPEKSSFWTKISRMMTCM